MLNRHGFGHFIGCHTPEFPDHVANSPRCLLWLMPRPGMNKSRGFPVWNVRLLLSLDCGGLLLLLFSLLLFTFFYAFLLLFFFTAVLKSIRDTLLWWLRFAESWDRDRTLFSFLMVLFFTFQEAIPRWPRFFWWRNNSKLSLSVYHYNFSL